MKVRESVPRADNLITIRDITCVFENGKANSFQFVFEKAKKMKISPPKGVHWSKSNFREYIAALIFLKMIIRIRKGVYYLGEKGKELKKIANFGSKSLSLEERNFFIRLLFDNKRFLNFLKLFTRNIPISTPENFIKVGNEMDLDEKSVAPIAKLYFGYFDKREFSKKGVFVNWAMSVGILEKDYETGKFFPTYYRRINMQHFLTALYDTYTRLRDKRTLRAEIHKVRNRVCKKLRIPRFEFDEYLINISSKYPHIISLERAPLISFKSPEYGLVKDRGEIYYYIVIRGNLNELSISLKRKDY